MSVPNDFIVFKDPELKFRNFQGIPSKFNKEGKRNFCIVLDMEQASKMDSDGWNVKRLRTRHDGTEEFDLAILPVHIPADYTLFDAPSLDLNLYRLEITIRPDYWTHGSETGKRAFVESIKVDL